VAEMKECSAEERDRGRRLALVPTMGAFHEGHLSLIAAAGQDSDLLVVSIFVNPTQFGPGEDYEAYPRDFEKDVQQAEELGVHVVYAPSVEEMYPQGYEMYVEADRTGHILCGRSRPGHFRGVLSVVLKLFTAVNPHKAYFGEKDYQQLLLIRRMVADFHLDVEVVGMPIVREPDGLAASSRNAYLSSEARQSALGLSRALFRARETVTGGERDAAALRRKIISWLEEDRRVVVDYVAVCHPETLEEVRRIGEEVVILLAAKVEGTRLIDNLRVAT